MQTKSFRKYFLRFTCLLTALAAGLKAQSPMQNLRIPRPPARPDSQLAQSPGQGTLPVQSFSLEQLLQMARTNNPTLGQAQAGIREPAGRTQQDGIWPYPTVG